MRTNRNCKDCNKPFDSEWPEVGRCSPCIDRLMADTMERYGVAYDPKLGALAVKKIEKDKGNA